MVTQAAARNATMKIVHFAKDRPAPRDSVHLDSPLNSRPFSDNMILLS